MRDEENYGYKTSRCLKCLKMNTENPFHSREQCSVVKLRSNPARRLEMHPDLIPI